MKKEEFLKLDSLTQEALIIALHIRNEMEGFHADHLSDDQMKELNPIIRQAIFDILTYLTHAERNNFAANYMLNLQIARIPDYWELPDKDAPLQNLLKFNKILELP